MLNGMTRKKYRRVSLVMALVAAVLVVPTATGLLPSYIGGITFVLAVAWVVVGIKASRSATWLNQNH